MRYIDETKNKNIGIHEFYNSEDTIAPSWKLTPDDLNELKKSDQVLALWCGEDDYIGNMLLQAEEFGIETTSIEL